MSKHAAIYIKVIVDGGFGVKTYYDKGDIFSRDSVTLIGKIFLFDIIDNWEESKYNTLYKTS